MENTAVSPASVECWRVIAASVRGTSHLKANLPCQDVLRWEVRPGARLLAALADGAGSASFAEVGAAIAARRGLEVLAHRLTRVPEPLQDDDWQTLLREAIRSAREAILAEAQTRQVRPRELATTLILLVVTPTLAAAAQIGDGAALVAESVDRLAPLTRPLLTEYLNETTFLTSEAALEAIQVAVQRGAWRHAALLCDGLQLLALKLPEATPHLRFFQPLFRHLERAPNLAAAGEELQAFLQSPRVIARADDDLTLLLASLGPGDALPLSAEPPGTPHTAGRG